MSCENHCRHFLSVSSIESANGQLQITIAPENLIDGFWYTLKLQHAIPPGLKGTETVFVFNGPGGTAIQLTDWRGRYLLSERLLKGGERLRMVYTENGPGNNPVPIFEVREGIIQIP